MAAPKPRMSATEAGNTLEHTVVKNRGHGREQNSRRLSHVPKAGNVGAGRGERRPSSSASRASFNGKGAPTRQPVEGSGREGPKAPKARQAAAAAAVRSAAAAVVPPPCLEERVSTSFFSPASTSAPASPTNSQKDELETMREKFEARESELLQEVAELRGALATARIAQAAAEASVMELRGELSRANHGLRAAEAGAIAISKNIVAPDCHSEEISQLRQQLLELQQNVMERALEGEQRLSEQRMLLEAQIARQQDQFRSECDRIWSAMADANTALRPSRSEHSAAEQSVSRPPDPSAGAVLRQIYAAVSELP